MKPHSVTVESILGEQPKVIFARLLGEGASSLVSDPILKPTLKVYRLQESGERILVSSNEGWTDAEGASLLEVASQKLGLQEILHESGDAGVFLLFDEGVFEIEFGNGSPLGSEAQFQLYLLD